MRYLKTIYKVIKNNWKVFVAFLSVLGAGVLVFLWKRQGINISRIETEKDLKDSLVGLDDLQAKKEEADAQLSSIDQELVEIEAKLAAGGKLNQDLLSQVDSMTGSEKLAKFKELGY